MTHCLNTLADVVCDALARAMYSLTDAVAFVDDRIGTMPTLALGLGLLIVSMLLPVCR